MKKSANLFSLVLLWGFVLCGFFAISDARIIGTNPTGTSADLWCNGGQVSAGNTVVSTTEVCQDASGNLIPTTTNTGALGTASLQWANAQVAGTVAAAAVVPTNTTSSRLHIPFGTGITTTTMLAVVTTGGDEYLTQNTAGTLFWHCVSTGGTTAANLVFSSNTAAACRQSP